MRKITELSVVQYLQKQIRLIIELKKKFENLNNKKNFNNF
jgi:hypothetical protein